MLDTILKPIYESMSPAVPADFIVSAAAAAAYLAEPFQEAEPDSFHKRQL